MDAEGEMERVEQPGAKIWDFVCRERRGLNSPEPVHCELSPSAVVWILLEVDERLEDGDPEEPVMLEVSVVVFERVEGTYTAEMSTPRKRAPYVESRSAMR